MLLENILNIQTLIFLRATLSITLDDKDYPHILSDIDKAIQLHSSVKFETIYNSIAEMYVLRAKVDMHAGNDQQAMNDIEMAIKAEPTTNLFNNGGVKPKDESNPTAMQKRDFDLLVAKHSNDYRAHILSRLLGPLLTSAARSE
jgi:hypothetical protein